MLSKSITPIKQQNKVQIPTKRELLELYIIALLIILTTGTVERNQSVYSFIYNLKKNRLTYKRVNKLVYMFQNLKLRYLVTNDDEDTLLLPLEHNDKYRLDGKELEEDIQYELLISR